MRRGIVTDTFGRPWREGLVDVALGVAGLDPLEDHRGHKDRYGRMLDQHDPRGGRSNGRRCWPVMPKAGGCPAALIRGFEWQPAEGSARSLLRKPEQDLFR